jgi:hypothetical protein
LDSIAGEAAETLEKTYSDRFTSAPILCFS